MLFQTYPALKNPLCSNLLAKIIPELLLQLSPTYSNSIACGVLVPGIETISLSDIYGL